MTDALLTEIAARRDDLIALTQDLIRIPTLNPPGRNYREICAFLAERLAKSGFKVEMIRAEGAIGDSVKYPRWNMVARHEGGAPGDCVHFNSHHDVVEVGHGWTRDPFGGELDDGKIYGRGACDMKGGLAASIIAAEAFVHLYPDHEGAVEISATADEESGGYGGVAYLAEKGYFDPDRVQHVIIPEPLNKDRICLGHRGVWWAEIETKGRIAHGSMPFLGDSAIRHMSAVLAEMEQHLYPLLASKRTEMPVVPDGAKQSTLNVNSIHGGEAEPEDGYDGFPAPCVADRCRIVIDRRFLIEEDLNEVKAEVHRMMERIKDERPDFEYEIRDMHEVVPTMTDKGAPVVTSTAAAIEKVLGARPEYVVSPGTYDQKHIDRIGRLKNCIAYGPGILDLAHQPDEWVGVQDMQDSAGVMALVLHELLITP
ncbi:acetylornithine deacetylase/succinyl-diaminopimelate desuccinylase family protein [Aliiroseovarius subalbicans]|uniref:acetylornithine deacetylase/succinyl-diaminopimelate desuccinylase family protein n=1 Tax=Aliiroseovarius subalbicans TaxID=2925840 RepID=UPI001F569CE5|nr:acetylornithine deacetylase/succinyl-diaminopimelate desuccinylase family protein [Aliiroseovarius subalbicans]MCI2400542.1 acetylornithine deacetylase/succinyl-diaminopimelate desuccinylase family protein [Aliiroseovarius subalbicans]